MAPKAHNTDMTEQTAAERLRAIREASGLSIGKLAERLGMAQGTYRHYEERSKKQNLPVELVTKLLHVMEDFPQLQADIRSLIDVHEIMPAPGFAESPAQARGHRLANDLYDRQPNAPEFVIQSDGRHLTISAFVDSAGLTKLIERLELARALLD
jgi:transcriptional regulator with XRE-family HTH domain